jgi:hypothetical protein
LRRLKPSPSRLMGVSFLDVIAALPVGFGCSNH